MKSKLLIFFVFHILYDCCYGRTSDDLKVTLSHGGKLLGRHLTSHKGRNFKAFMGIPYAQPPINELRFQPPVAAQGWVGERDATSDSNLCLQRDPFRRDYDIVGSEDCLYLNVYAPEVKDNELLPVMVFFHGGGWICGSGISAFYGPDFLMDHNVIYVSGNFRLGILGFLSTETHDCPGNNGLKDQVAILKWVKENIAAFGGDPNRVTIFGESAGGASVTYHMTSAMSKGLFQQGISQSGTYLNPWAQPAHKGVAASRALKLAKLMNCDNKVNDWGRIIHCLKTKTAEEITMAMYDFFEWDFDPMIPFPPVVEPKSEHAFITEHPVDIKNPHGQDYAWLMGLTAQEGVLKTAPLLNTPEALQQLKDNLNELLAISLFYDHHSDSMKRAITDKIRKFYFSDNKFDWSIENHHNLTNLYSDAWFLAGCDKYLRQRLSKKSGPTYVYLFDHKGSASFSEIFRGGRENYYGVCHAEELQYLFPIGKHLFSSAFPTEKDIEVREALLEMWVNFATYGNPTPEVCKLETWKPASSYPVKYIRIGSQDHSNWKLMQNEENFLQERANFWHGMPAHLSAEKIKDEL